jgi:membrane complex biogenesis BtpA family protein
MTLNHQLPLCIWWFCFILLIMKKLLIGAIHLPPTPGYDEYPGFETSLKNALEDLNALERGGMNSIIIENNYDIPHKETVSQETIDEMISIGREISKETKLPIGVSVLWNDFESAFKIAKEIGAKFIRVPVFVDKVETNYGIMEPKHNEVISIQKKLGCEHIKIYADIHVKHSKILSDYSVKESAELAIKNGADVLIVTGSWTGDSPDIKDLVEVKKISKDVPVICGSGVNSENIRDLFKISDGAIISTSLKEDSDKIHTENVKPYDIRISEEKTKELTGSLSD